MKEDAMKVQKDRGATRRVRGRKRRAEEGKLDEEKWHLVRRGKRKTFFVSSLGRCKTEARHKNGTVEETISDGVYNDLSGTLFFDGDAVHRHVARAFVPNPRGLPYVDHLNYDTLDNRAANLCWTDVRVDLTKKKAMRGRVKLPPRARKQAERPLRATSLVVLAENASTGETAIFKDGVEATRRIGCTAAAVYRTLDKVTNQGERRRCFGWTLTRMPFLEAQKKLEKISKELAAAGSS